MTNKGLNVLDYLIMQIKGMFVGSRRDSYPSKWMLCCYKRRNL